MRERTAGSEGRRPEAGTGGSSTATPAAVATGTLVLDVQPWAKVEVTRVDDNQAVKLDVDVTPCRNSLAPGIYRVVATNPTQGSDTFEIAIDPGVEKRVYRKLSPFDAERAALVDATSVMIFRLSTTPGTTSCSRPAYRSSVFSRTSTRSTCSNRDGMPARRRTGLRFA